MEFDKTKNKATIYLKFHRYKEFKNKIEIVKDLIDELTELGEDYAIFRNAKISHKKLKSIKKDLKYIG